MKIQCSYDEATMKTMRIRCNYDEDDEDTMRYDEATMKKVSNENDINLKEYENQSQPIISGQSYMRLTFVYKIIYD
ncbi:hypothetical protein OSB04_028781 [Centaurea solstitialis]|uniref:Uncharacterized protein n=1 Tax=Centaurea solstitialis TaxID=347529 RepID=A0AA38STV8_9ASTR|nr:hypothetical protein OSB04_028781 [Centaurea solstitialis]